MPKVYTKDGADVITLAIDDGILDSTTKTIKTIEYEHYTIHDGSHYYIEGHAELGTDGVLYSTIQTPDSDLWIHLTWRISSNGILSTMLYEIPTGGMANGNRATIHASNRTAERNCWSGRHTGANDAAVLTDSSQAWTPDALIGLQIFNQTDGSSGIITGNDTTTVTATLSGSTDGGNEWDTADVYEINGSQLVITSGVTVATSLGLEISDSDVGGEGFKNDIGGLSQQINETILRPNTKYLRKFLSGSDNNIVSFRASWYEHTNL